ncbi:hypothetical protein D3C87_1008920 [compost metagenome]
MLFFAALKCRQNGPVDGVDDVLPARVCPFADALSAGFAQCPGRTGTTCKDASRAGACDPELAAGADQRRYEADNLPTAARQLGRLHPAGSRSGRGHGGRWQIHVRHRAVQRAHTGRQSHALGRARSVHRDQNGLPFNGDQGRQLDRHAERGCGETQENHFPRSTGGGDGRNGRRAKIQRRADRKHPADHHQL